MKPGSSIYPSTIGMLFDTSKIYKLPLYQRQYIWRDRQLKDYKKDIDNIWEALTNNEDEEIFLGGVILQSDSLSQQMAANAETFIVIDGQQRLTTLFITLIGFVEFALDNNWEQEADSLISTVLKCHKHSNLNEPLIQPTSNDINDFNFLLNKINTQTNKRIKTLNGGTIHKSNQLLIKAYNFIKKDIIEYNIELMDGESPTKPTWLNFYNGLLNNFIIADIYLDETKHNSNEVFDRLNVRGQRLSSIDLIRNNIFMLNSEYQKLTSKNYNSNNQNQHDTQLFNNKWKPFQDHLETKFADRKNDQKTIDDQVDDFFFPFALNKNHKIAKSRLVHSLNNVWKGSNPDNVISDMDDYIEHYFTWLKGDDFKSRIDQAYSKTLREAIVHLHQLNVPKATYSFLMRCLYELKNSNITELEVTECFNIVESFLFRRIYVYDDEMSGIHAIFKKLWDDTKGDPKKVRQKIETKTKIFPDDKAFKDSILNKGLYIKNVQKYALLQYEEHLANNSFETYPNQTIQTCDHLMPQSQKKMNYKSAHEKNEHDRTVNLWGNLFPMSKSLNSKKSNMNTANFYKNLKKHTRFESIECLDNKYKNKKWGPNLIDDRTKVIANWALKRWKFY